MMLHVGATKSNAMTDHESSHETSGADPGGAPPRPPKMRSQHQNSTKLRPQNGSFRPVTIWGPPPPRSNPGSAPGHRLRLAT